MQIDTATAQLEFEIIGSAYGDITFRTTIRDGDFSGSVEANDFRVGTPVSLFEEMAANWRGWEGALDWCEHEDRLSLSATHDGRGHVTMTVTMQRPEPRARLAATIMLDAGQLDDFARQARALFG